MTSVITSKPIAIPDVICDFGWRYGLQPIASQATVSRINKVLNPSFEYDALNAAPVRWFVYESSNTPSAFRAENGWAQDGTQSLRFTRTAAGAEFPGVLAAHTGQGTGGIPARPGATYYAQITVKILTNTTTGSTPGARVRWYSSSGTQLTDSLIQAGNLPTTPGVYTYSANVTAPANAAYGQLMINANSLLAGQILDMYVDSAMLGIGTSSYADGDSTNWAWRGAPGNSISVDQKGGTFQTPLQQVITFDAIDSQSLAMPKIVTPTGVSIIDYHWDFGNGQIGRGPFATTTYTYAKPPPDLKVSLSVTDSHNRTYSCAKPINLQSLTPLYGTSTRERG